MPRSTTTISIFLASPNDLKIERELITKWVSEWNQINGTSRSIFFELLKWESTIAAGFGPDGQEVVNRSLPPYDLLVAVFWTRLGSPTPRAVSGTAEEYERALERYVAERDIEIAFYFKDTAVNPREIDLQQLVLVHEFEQKVQSQGAFSKRFSDHETLHFEINLLLDRAARRFALSSNINSVASGKATLAVASKGPLTSSAFEDDEPGLFDISDNLVRHATEATAILADIGAQMNTMATILNESNEAMNGVALMRTLTIDDARPHVQRISKGMENFSLTLEANLPTFTENSVSLANDIRSLIDVSYDFTEAPDAEESLVSFDQMLSDLLKALRKSSSSYNDFMTILIGLQRTSLEFNRARRRLVKNLSDAHGANKTVETLIGQARSELAALLEKVRSGTSSTSA